MNTLVRAIYWENRAALKNWKLHRGAHQRKPWYDKAGCLKCHRTKKRVLRAALMCLSLTPATSKN